MESSIDKLKIRLILPDDKDRISRFFRALGDEGSAFFNRCSGNENRTYDFLQGKLPDHIFWAATYEGDSGEEIAGIVFLWRKDTGVPWLGIGITEDWKGKHLGRRLMDTAKNWAVQNGAGGIMLTTAQTNVRGQGLYERMGYEKLGTYFDGEILYLLTFDKNTNIS